MKINQPKTDGSGRVVEASEDIQEKLSQESYVHHDHGGREHGHDWDDWLRADRAIGPKHRKKPREAV